MSALLPPLPGARPADDVRVRAAAEVLAGVPVQDVADRAGLDPVQVSRWADALSRGGAAAVGGIGLERTPSGVADRVPVEDFLAVVTHELRSPLTAARAGLRVLVEDGVEAELREQVGRSVLARLQDLAQLTDDVEDAVAVTTGRVVLRPRRVDLVELVADACAGAAVSFARPSPVHVHVDGDRVRTAVRALLAHTARHAGPADTRVAVQQLDDAALLSVRLAGLRLTREQARAAFEPFGAAAGTDGHGLAMYVVRALVVASGGMVGVAGDDAADVTVYWVRLPLAAPRSLPAPRTADVRPLRPL